MRVLKEEMWGTDLAFAEGKKGSGTLSADDVVKGLSEFFSLCPGF